MAQSPSHPSLTASSKAQKNVNYGGKDGSLLLSGKGQSLRWSAASDDAPTRTIAISTITNLRQTPKTSPKVSVRVVVQQTATSAPENHTFTFTGPNARADADAIKEKLTHAIHAHQAAAVSKGSAANGAPAAMAIASAMSKDGGARGGGWMDDRQLLADPQLQQALLRSDPSLQRTFMESLRVKPNETSAAQFSSQFWSSRLSALRAFAIDQSQRKGTYNVLSTVKPKTVDNVLRLSLTPEQINLIFAQHPLVRRVYDECVPRLNDDQFWARFFQSRLLKKLKGEKITEIDPVDAILDKYLNEDNSMPDRRRTEEQHVPHFIDLEGNEENHSQRKGNRPDVTMRPTAIDRVPVFRSLNNLSQKIMNEVQSVDVDPANPIGVLEDNYDELALQDLQGNQENPGVALRLAQTGQRHGGSEEAEVMEEEYDARLVKKGLRSLMAGLEDFEGHGLEMTLELESESDDLDESEDEDEDEIAEISNGPRANALNSKEARMAAQAHLIGLIPNAVPDLPALPSAIHDRLVLTHATTVEFLHQFWSAFLSDQHDSRAEARSAIESLGRAVTRMKAVGDDAEQEREKELAKRKKEVRDIYEQRGVRVRMQGPRVAGRREAELLLSPTMAAVERARSTWRASRKR